MDERGLPVGEEPFEGTDYDVLRARPIGTTKLDHAFTTLSPGDDGLVRVQLRAAGGGASRSGSRTATAI